MPCFLVITIELQDEEAVHKAAKELGLAPEDYTWEAGSVQLRRPELQGQLRQHYGLVVAEAQARRRGYSTRRGAQQDGAGKLLVRTS